MLCAFLYSIYIYFLYFVPIKSLTFLFARIFLLLTLNPPPSNISPANLMVYIGAQNNIKNTAEKKEGKINEGGAMSSYQQRRISEQTYKFPKCTFFFLLLLFIFLCVVFVVGFRVDFSFFFFGSRKKMKKKVELGKKAENQYGKMIRKKKKSTESMCVCVFLFCQS